MEAKVKKALKLTEEFVKRFPEGRRNWIAPTLFQHFFLGADEESKKTKKFSSKETRDFEGLSGGLHFLLSENFFIKPKSLGEIHGELKKYGYHYPLTSLPPRLKRFYKPGGPLVRFHGEEGKWRYVIRK